MLVLAFATPVYLGLMLMMVKEIGLKLTLGMAEQRKTESPPDEES